MEMENRKCNYCKIQRPVNFFSKNRKDEYNKSCEECRVKQKANREKYKCTHNRQKSRCKDCGGVTICSHNREKHRCKECGDPVKITIKNMIKGSRHSDKKKNRYDPVKFIDYCFVEGLIEDYKNCYWCKVELQYTEYNKTLASIERLDNKKGHNKDNCVLCCLDCNKKRISNI